jgi:hypothetical protein
MCKVLVLALLVLRAAAGGQGACTNPDADEIERIMALAGFARPAIAVVQGSAVRADELVSMNVQDLIDLFGGDLAPMAVRGAPTDRAPGEVRSMEGWVQGDNGEWQADVTAWYSETMRAIELVNRRGVCMYDLTFAGWWRHVYARESVRAAGIP